MFGLTEYIAAGVTATAVAWGGYQAIEAGNARTDLARVENKLAVSQSRLQTCSARLTNIKEAEASNAEIPDDLLEFNVPDAWRVQPEGAGP